MNNPIRRRAGRGVPGAADLWLFPLVERDGRLLVDGGRREVAAGPGASQFRHLCAHFRQSRVIEAEADQRLAAFIRSYPQNACSGTSAE